jgi:hypothetical protein
VENRSGTPLQDDLDTSSAVETPTDAEDIALAGGPYPQPRRSGLVLTVILFIFFMAIFAAALLFIYNNGQQNGLTAALAEPSPTPAPAPGTERIVVSAINASPIVSSENVMVQVTTTPVPNVTPSPGTTPQAISVQVTNYYTGATLSLTISDVTGNVPTPEGGTPPPLAQIQNVAIRFVFYNSDGSAAGNWIESFGPIPLNGSQKFTTTIPTKPGLGKWDGTQSIQPNVYAILTQQ